MKYIILSALAITLMMVSCNQKNEQVKTTNSETTENSSQLYACPMHPEITGKKGDKCPKCGMELTEPVVQSTKSTSNTPTDVTAESTAAP
ncbi:heavy metal-binding domain-containing protein, partial [Flavobacterium sp. GT3R68]